ncbi:His Kinase A (phospho-acceptor) domain-containing protein [Paenibacillus sp. 1_12]|uniref:sensor histidine kinase n=1 Tax=Paenibacillus sp. 1_12 TaxID=1566278 RepID=UPI0008ECEC2F|nr:HAMP domain-containing sensor histidine kinase [Paenibacillus sp. 1_12]SFK74699.1 His Kinase A (phospho-acceptor) domain-containing protein [Paenibacillus sp. 1_12]
MDNPNFLTSVRSMKPVYITYWCKLFRERFPDHYEEAMLQSLGEAGFNYITEFHIAVDTHSLQHSLMDGFFILETQEEGLELILWAMLLWRHTLQEAGEDSLTLALFKQMSSRIDDMEALILTKYWKKQQLGQDNSSALTLQHDDRISLLGKMAASMAHEIRNPMTSIKGFLKLLRYNINQNSYERADSYLGFIEDECEQILMQVTGFLSFSRKPIMDEEMVHISVRQVLDHILSLLNPRLINENVDLTLNVPQGSMLYVQKMGIQQVLSNVLNNGIDAVSELKSNKKMSISVVEDSSNTIIQVANNGPSVPEELYSTIFNPFVTHKENGTGLGLAICKQIMLNNEGDITFTSNEKETVFELTFRKASS